jgi:hypothetical protein
LSAGEKLWRIDGPRAIVLDSIVSALAVVRASLPRGASIPANLDIVAAEDSGDDARPGDQASAMDRRARRRGRDHQALPQANRPLPGDKHPLVVGRSAS